MANSLLTPWVFWNCRLPLHSTKYDLSDNYDKVLNPLASVTSLEDFFSAYLFLKRPSEIPCKNNLGFFKTHKKPMWESCRGGGCLIIPLPKSDGRVDLIWETLLFACISGQISDNVDGVLVTSKYREIVFQVWISYAELTYYVVANQIKEFLSLDDIEVYFKKHVHSMTHRSTMKNAELVSFN